MDALKRYLEKISKLILYFDNTINDIAEIEILKDTYYTKYNLEKVELFLKSDNIKELIATTYEKGNEEYLVVVKFITNSGRMGFATIYDNEDFNGGPRLIEIYN